MTFGEEVQQLHKILCTCPNPECSQIMHASELHFKVKGMIIKTWLDLYRKKREGVEKKEENFDEKEKEIREKAKEKGRMDAKKVINKCMFPIFKRTRTDLSDVIPLMHPIDFVIFNGMCEKNKVSDIIFLSRKTQFQQLEAVRKQVKSAIEQKKYNWLVGKVQEDGKISFE